MERRASPPVRHRRRGLCSNPNVVLFDVRVGFHGLVSSGDRIPRPDRADLAEALLCCETLSTSRVSLTYLFNPRNIVRQ